MGALERLTYLLGICVAVITWAVAQLTSALTADQVIGYSISTHSRGSDQEQIFRLENLSRSQRPPSIKVEERENPQGCITLFRYLPDMNRLLRSGAAAVALTALVAVPAHAQFGSGIVFDPTNYSQNVLTAARELQQVNNELQSLENQATSLLNQSRNLASLPYSSLSVLDQSILQTELLLTQAQRISYSVSAINQAFSQNYPVSYPVGTSSQQLMADAQNRWQNSLAAFQDAMNVQATAVQNLGSTHSQIDALIGASQSATGALQAQQSGNQLVGLETTQLANLTAVMVAIARAQSLEGARELENEEQAQTQTNDFLDYGAGYQPGNAQMFH